MAVEEGMAAPDFSMESTEGRVISLAGLRGKKVVLFFYPKDDTPGCTKEACGFRDTIREFEKAGVVVLGVSPDDVKSHAKFRKKFELPFTLLADAGHVVAEAYGIWKEKSMWGKKYMGVERTTVVIDEEGKVAKIFPKVNVEGHEAEVLAAVRGRKS